MHGAIYLELKTEGDMQSRVRGWVRPLTITFILAYALTTLATVLFQPAHGRSHSRSSRVWFAGRDRQRAGHRQHPARDLQRTRVPRVPVFRRPRSCSCSRCAGIGLFPTLLRSTSLPERSLTIYNAASSPQTLGIMLTIAVIGIPVVLTYTTVIYWIFRGKVRLGSHSY